MEVTARTVWIIAAVLGVALVILFVWSERFEPGTRATIGPEEPAELPQEPEPDGCRFLANGNYLCTEPVGAPRCGLAVVAFEPGALRGIMHKPWPEEHEAAGRLTVEASRVVLGPGAELVELGDAHAWSLTVGLSEAAAELRIERPLATVSPMPGIMMVFMNPEDEEAASSALVAHCYWPVRESQPARAPELVG